MEYNFWFFYLIGIAVAFLSIFTKQKKALQIITLVCAFIVLSSCVPSHMMWNDLNNYEVNFNSLVEFYSIKLANDWAYYNSMYICKLLGMSYMEAYQLSSQAVTVPGASEHQIGLALDIVCNDYMSLDEGFGDTKAGKWLAANSGCFGFILRYPEGKENITGIEYEPWHFRYVGKAAAPVIMEQGITLEEFWEEYVEDVSTD